MKKLSLILFLALFTIQLSAQDEVGGNSQISLTSWTNVTALDYSLGFGEDEKHRFEASFQLLFDDGFSDHGAELLYHHRLAKAGNGSVLIGVGARYYQYDSTGEGLVSVPMTYRYEFPDHPFTARARITMLVLAGSEIAVVSTPSLGLGWNF